MSMVDHLIWEAVVPGNPLNTNAAIYQLWRAERDAGRFLGAPLSGEVQVTDDEVQVPFASGAVIAWNPRDGARLV
jgi:hypothetical protein